MKSMSPKATLNWIKVASVTNFGLFVTLVFKVIDWTGLSTGWKIAAFIAAFVAFKAITVLLFALLGRIKCPSCLKPLSIEHKMPWDKEPPPLQLKLNSFTPLSIPNKCPNCDYEINRI
ncbi:MAG: hypothetical protein GY770_35490 [Aestuariibacter sp.]|nr:hypothetical protein [Aestuariibacter sp.]